MDINQTITLGIGVPSGILEFLTFGLQIGAVGGWAPVDDTQTGNWSNIDDSQTDGWNPIDDTQTDGWTEITT